MMPSLLRYFTIVGSALLVLMLLANWALESGGSRPKLVAATQPKPAIKHDPGASRVERLRLHSDRTHQVVARRAVGRSGLDGDRRQVRARLP